MNLDDCIADIDQIRRYLPQRFEMEQLSRIIHEDLERHVCVGCRDISDDEFWVRPHARHAADARCDHVRGGRPALLHSPSGTT
ncbi:MAG: hypothetical protein R3C10_01230 [Pirellulales bacterium]